MSERNINYFTGFPIIVGLSDPIAESNIGNKMLQSMGWSPGTGLGVDGSGIKTPVMATMRPRRQGLGMGEGPSSTSSSAHIKHTTNPQQKTL